MNINGLMILLYDDKIHIYTKPKTIMNNISILDKMCGKCSLYYKIKLHDVKIIKINKNYYSYAKKILIDINKFQYNNKSIFIEIDDKYIKYFDDKFINNKKNIIEINISLVNFKNLIMKHILNKVIKLKIDDNKKSDIFVIETKKINNSHDNEMYIKRNDLENIKKYISDKYLYCYVLMHNFKYNYDIVKCLYDKNYKINESIFQNKLYDILSKKIILDIKIK